MSTTLQQTRGRRGQAKPFVIRSGNLCWLLGMLICVKRSARHAMHLERPLKRQKVSEIQALIKEGNALTESSRLTMYARKRDSRQGLLSLRVQVKESSRNGVLGRPLSQWPISECQ